MKRVINSIILVVAVFSTAAFGQNASYKSIKVADGVYSFGGGPWSYYTMFVVADEGVFVADPVNPDLAAAMMQEIRKITDKPIRYMAYSHNHWDHVSGGKIFKDAGAVVISHVETKKYLRPNPQVVVPGLTWDGDRYDVVLGNKTIELHYFGENHGSGMTVMLLPKEKVMFTADLVVPRRVGYMFLPDFSVSGWIQTLKEMEKLDFTVGLFAHDHPKGSKRDLISQREYLEDLTMAVQQAMQSGDMMLKNLSLPKYKDWAHYDDWLGLNGAYVMLEMMMGLQ